MQHIAFTRYLLAFVCLFSLAACAATGTTSGTIPTGSSQAELSGQQMQAIDARLQRLQDSLVMLEARLLDQQRTIENLQRQQGSGGGVAGPTGGDDGTDTIGSSQQSPTEIYQTAFGDYAAGRYQQSINGFSRFIQFFPSNDYASNARYWLGECYLALDQPEQAVVEFDRVVSDYPKSTKAPDAMLKKAAALYQTNKEEGALETIQLLKERYPKSSAAKKAEESFN